MKRFLLLLFIVIGHTSFSQGSYGEWEKKFEQLGTMLPTPNTYRAASGAPGIDYWQQKADYKIHRLFLHLKCQTHLVERAYRDLQTNSPT